MRPRRPSSLAAQLFRRTVLLVVMIGLAMAALTYWAARTQIHEAADSQLVTAANVLYALMQDEMREQQGQAAPISIEDNLLSGEDLRAFRASADRRMFVVFRDGRPIFRSDTAPLASLRPRQSGFATVEAPGGAWRIYGLTVPADHLIVQVGEQFGVRDAVLVNVGRNILFPLLLLIVGSAGLLWISLHDGLLHLRQLSTTLSYRAPRDIRPLQARDWPSDLMPLVTSLNDLFERVDAAFWRERQFTDDAAHQLRTPLAAVKLQVQALMRIDDAEERRSMMAAVLQAVDRASALVAQMLTLARLDAGEGDREPVDIAAILIECIADQAGVAAQRDVGFAFVGERQLRAGSDATALRLIFSNLLENAVKHTPADTTVGVELVRRGSGRVVVAIADHGPGIAEADRAVVLRRFHRSADGCVGTGLGLAIVTSAIRLLDGDLTMESNAGTGLVVRVSLPC